LREVSEKIFKDDYEESKPVFIETDGACAGNAGKTSPGGWGAIIVQGTRMLKKWGARPDTSNNEMEYEAMLEALQFVRKGAFVIMETDSQGCLDGLTKYRLRWEKNGWRTSDGKPVENVQWIQAIGRKLDVMHVGFWKVKGHNKDPWNDLAYSLEVKGRDKQATEVVIQLLFRAVIGGTERFDAIPRFSVSSHANIYYFWPTLIGKFGREIGEPEDYEIWNAHSPLSGPLINGLSYEIVSRITPGRPRPRRNSAECSAPLLPRPAVTFEPEASLQPSGRAKVWSPPQEVRLEEPARGIPPQWSAQVIYQAHDAPEKEWRSWFTAEDTEYSIKRRARNALNIIGSWRRSSYCRREWNPDCHDKSKERSHAPIPHGT
jgi:ribonuclease HI